MNIATKTLLFRNKDVSLQHALSNFTQCSSHNKYFESAVGAHIINEAFVHRFEVMYWREGNDEVDFVLRKNRKVVAIEVKSNGEAATTGLARFRQLFSPASAFIVGDSGIKPEVFLGMNLNGLFA